MHMPQGRQILLAVALTFTACGSSSTGSPGDGGPFTGSGGRSGAGGALGGGGCQLPPCFASYAALASQCAGAGACLKQGATVGVGSAAHYCFANGVKEHFTIQSSAMATARFTRTDGVTTCYSVDVFVGPPRPNDSLGFSYRDGNGTLIGTAESQPDGSLMISCGGVSQTLSEACLDQMNMMMPSTSTRDCKEGACQ
jgi:hypothetical protein